MKRALTLAAVALAVVGGAVPCAPVAAQNRGEIQSGQRDASGSPRRTASPQSYGGRDDGGSYRRGDDRYGRRGDQPWRGRDNDSRNDRGNDYRNNGYRNNNDRDNDRRAYDRRDNGRRDNGDRSDYRKYDYDRPDPRYGNYQPERYYRPGDDAPRPLGRNDRIYRGGDGQYYCRRSDGTTGLVVGALSGGVLGNVLSPGGSTTLGTVLGGGLGALLGRSIDRGGASCR